LKSRRFISSFVTVALILGACAAGAEAHSALILIGDSTLVYEQKPTYPNNVDNKLTIALKEDASGAYYLITDPASTGIAFPSQCIPLDLAQEEIRCAAAGIAAIYVRLGTATSERTTTDSVTIAAPTPATVSGGTVNNAGGPRTSDITVGPVGGNVIYGNPGPGTLNSLNGFPDTIHSCAGNVVQADPLIDKVIEDCAPPPEPPVSPEPEPIPHTPLPGPAPGSPPSGPQSGPGSSSATTSTGGHTQTEAIVLSYKHPQSILRQRLVQFGVSVAMPLAVHAHGSITLPGRAGTVYLNAAHVHVATADVLVTMRLHVSSRGLARLRRAFAHHRRLYASIQVDATDPASGIEYLVSRRIALTR
jgi:hypothetical protein